jgi:hypothetical protein
MMRRVLCVGGGAWLMPLVVMSSGVAAPPSAARPNVLFILADDRY